MSAADYVLEDFWLFCEEALKMPLSEKPHMEMAEFISSPYSQNKLLLVPRGCWKTSLASIAYPLWMVLRANFLFGNPTYRVLIDSATVRLSKLVIQTIKGYVKNLDTLEALFGRLYNRKGDTQEGFSMSFRLDVPTGIKEPNFLASGVGAEKTGLHFELIVMDDVVTKENAHTPNGREKVYDHFRMMQGVIESSKKDGQTTNLLVVGTRYNDGDLYGKILKDDKKALVEGGAASFSPMIRQAVDTITGELFYPDKLDHVALQKKKKLMKGLFYAQFMNDPNQESAPFKPEWLKWKDWTEFPALHKVRVSVDTAVKADEADRGDYTCLVVAGWDQWHQLWIIDVVMKENYVAGTFIEDFFQLATKYQVDGALIEDDHSEFLMHVLRVEMQRRGYNIPITWVKIPSNMGKLSRWAELAPYAERGGIRISSQIPADLQVEIQDEWERAPVATHDDFMDALSLQTLYLPVSIEEGHGRIPFGTPLNEAKTLDERIAAKKAAGADGFYFGTLADRFPHVRALQMAKTEEADGYVLPETDEERLSTALEESFR